MILWELLNYDDGYGEMYGYPLMEKGCPLIKLYPNKHKIEVDSNGGKMIKVFECFAGYGTTTLR